MQNFHLPTRFLLSFFHFKLKVILKIYIDSSVLLLSRLGRLKRLRLQFCSRGTLFMHILTESYFCTGHLKMCKEINMGVKVLYAKLT